MPELPEVETVKNGLSPYLIGRTIKTIKINRPNLRIPFPKNMKSDIEGQKCISLRRRGKYIWADFENSKTLVIHLGMSGSFTINPVKQSKHDHVEFITDHNDRMTYHDPRRFGMMFMVETGQENNHPAFQIMGPEPLGNTFNAPILIERLANKKSPIKTAILDQSVIAGVGNIYACEALYMAGISPLRGANTIKGDRAERLVAAIKTVLQSAIESGGSTLRDHRRTDGTMGYFQHAFKVYGREGETCAETGGQIKRIIQSGRSTFYCPQKQR
jgi:formamidopyrimidine-DNA glycosylase